MASLNAARLAERCADMMSLADRFWAKVSIGDENACWDWQAFTNKNGYGWMYLDKKSGPTHRVSAMLHGLIDSLASPLHVLHKCDNRKCCNPAHLFVGTNADNVADRVVKGRSKGLSQYGETNGMSKLTDVQVGQIRGLYFAAAFSQSQLAKQYGVRQSHISRVVNGVRRGGVS